jgi:hypothetical protein
MKTSLFSLGLLIICLLIPGLALAQMFGGPPSFNPDVLDNPIDGGLSLLLGAGAAYGASRIRKSRMNRKKKEDGS